MEGVVLYVTLVKVFIKYPKHYIIGFTLISYGKGDFNSNPILYHTYRCSCYIHDDYSANWIFGQ